VVEGRAQAQAKGAWRMSAKDWTIRVPKSLACDRSVSAMARITYIVLMGFEGKDGAPAYPALQTLAWILGCHRKYAQRYIKELESVEWLHKKKFKNKDGQFQAIRYDLLRHRRHVLCLRPKALKPPTVLPTTVKVPTNKYQSYQYPTLTNTKRVNGALPEAIAGILATPDTRLVFDGEDWMGSLERLLGPKEWKQCGAMWLNRARSGEESAIALRNATEDFFILTPDQRAEIDNLGAWITDRYMRGFKKLKVIKK
jgi:hypothetical protein